jgi:hypothetical protein
MLVTAALLAGMAATVLRAPVAAPAGAAKPAS